MKARIHLVWLLMAAHACLGQINNVNIGTAPNDRTGDPLRTAFQKINTNDNWLNAKIDAGSNTANARLLSTSNSLVTQITNASSSLTALLTSSSAAMAGVWLTHAFSNVFYGVDGSAFQSAYAAAQNGDRISLGPGTYVIGSYFVVNKSVDIAGAGAGVWDKWNKRFVGGTIFQGRLQILAMATNCLFRDFSIQNDQDVFFCGVYATNVMNIRCQDVAVGCTTGSNAHNFFASGSRWEISGLRSYNSGAHGIVFKGCQDVVARRLYSWRNPYALTIKSSGLEYGDSRNVIVEDLVASECGSIFIHAVDAPSSLTNVHVRGVTFCSTQSWQTAFVVECLAGCSFSGAHISGATVSGGPALATIGAYTSNFFDVTFDHCEVNNYVPARLPVLNIANPTPTDVSQFSAKNIRVNQMTVDQVGYNARAKALFASAQSTGLSAGLGASALRVIYVLNGRIYVVWPGTWPLATAYIAAGDPIRLASGPLAGVYTNAGVSVATANDSPVPGTRVGDSYMILGPTSVANGVSTNVDVAPGKVLGRISNMPSAASAGLQITGGGVNSVTNSFESGTASCSIQDVRGNTATATYGNVNLAALQPAVLPAYGYAWSAGDHVDIGVFGGNASVQGWYPSSFRNLYAEVLLYGQLPCVMISSSSW
jgi:hypothetical protein